MLRVFGLCRGGIPSPLQRNHRTVTVLLATLLGASACGDRTGLLTSEADSERDGGGVFDADGVSDGDDAAGDGILCSLNDGPVNSCDAGPSAGPVQRCDVFFPVCTNTEFPGQGWGCCELNPPENHYDCAYNQFLPDASCQ